MNGRGSQLCNAQLSVLADVSTSEDATGVFLVANQPDLFPFHDDPPLVLLSEHTLDATLHRTFLILCLLEIPQVCNKFLTRSLSLNISQNSSLRVGTTTLSSSERRTTPTFAILSPLSPSGQFPPPKTGLPTPSILALPRLPSLSSTVSHQSRDSKNGPNLVPPPLRSIP